MLIAILGIGLLAVAYAAARYLQFATEQGVRFYKMPMFDHAAAPTGLLTALSLAFLGCVGIPGAIELLSGVVGQGAGYVVVSLLAVGGWVLWVLRDAQTTS